MKVTRKRQILSPMVPEPMEVDIQQGEQARGNVGTLATKLVETNISSTSAVVPGRNKVAEAEVQYLRMFGISVGYDEDEVEEGLLFIDEKTKPADFLEMLSTIKQNKEKLQQEQDEAASKFDGADGAFPPPPSVPSAGETGSFGRRSLPKEYKDRLLKDFSEEDENLSVEELKQRNAERQKMLKNAWQNQTAKEGQQEATVAAPKKKGRNRRFKRKKKKNQDNTQGQENKNSENAQKTSSNEGGDVKSGSPTDIMCGSPPSDSVVIISSEGDDDEDDDETCVLEAWSPPVQNNKKRNPSQECRTQPNTDHMPVYVQGKSKASTPPRNQGLPRPRHQSQPFNQWPGQNNAGGRGLLPTPRGPYNRYPRPLIPNLQAGPVRYQQPRPYYNAANNRPQQQVNMGNAGGRVPQSELRYIVIDGSNVAMR